MKFHINGTLPDQLGVVFVFGSNLAGRHGRGAALVASEKFGAIRGLGRGLMGCSYAIPTKGWSMAPLTIHEIGINVREFLATARRFQSIEFFITRVGCGLAGYKDEQVAPLFLNAPENCSFPEEWREFLLHPQVNPAIEKVA